MKKRKPEARLYTGTVIETSIDRVVVECRHGVSRTPRRFVIRMNPVAADLQDGVLYFTQEIESMPAKGATATMRVRQGRVTCWTHASVTRKLKVGDKPHQFRAKHPQSRPPRQPVGRNSSLFGGYRHRSSFWD